MPAVGVLTWNINASKDYRDERLAALCGIVRDLDPDVVCLQEVLSSTHDEIQRQLAAGRYKNSGYRQNTTGLQTVIFVRKVLLLGFETIPLSGRMKRTCVIARCHPPYPTVASCHLESFNHNAPCRLRQIDEIQKALESEPGIVLCGDMNFIQSQETFLAPFEDVGPDEHTYDSLRNTSIRDKFRTRLDRLYIKGMDKGRSRLVGTEPVNGIFPSDHFGIYAEFTV
ncbi:hypothetical protein HDU88_008772 [Geranomyces variabilis]|nr:hypothetical protein HDU88_008772 [Geranomyces variabilis]